MKGVILIPCNQLLASTYSNVLSSEYVQCLCSSLQSIFNMISKEDQKNLPDDENTPEKRTDKIWDFFGKKEHGKRVLV